MNSNGKGGGNDDTTVTSAKKELQKKWKERQEEVLLIERFKNVALERLDQMSREASSSSSSSSSGSSHGSNSEKQMQSYTLGSEEQKVIRKLNGMGLPQGIGATIVTFIVLRRGPVYMARAIQRRQFQRRQQQQQQQSSSSSSSSSSTPPGTYQFSNPNNTNNSSSMSNNPFHRAREHQQQYQNGGSGGGSGPELPPIRSSKRHWFGRAIWFTFDVTLSLMMGASVSMAYTDLDEIRREIVELPLVKGRSLVSEAFCDRIVQELAVLRKENPPAYQRLQREIKHHKKQQQEQQQQSMISGTTSPDNNNINAMYLESIEVFARNCQRRRYAESRLSSDYGITSIKNQPVELMNPVPRDGPRLVVVEKTNDVDDDTTVVEQRVVFGDDDDDDDVDFSTSDDDPNNSWTDTFVMDQEETFRGNTGNSTTGTSSKK